MNKATNTATHPRHGDHNQNQQKERAINMKKAIFQKVSGVLSIALALATIAIVFGMQVFAATSFSGQESIQWNYSGQGTKYTGSPSINVGDNIAFTGTLKCTNTIKSAAVGIYTNNDATGPVKNAEGKDKVITKTINSTSLDVFTGLDQMLNYTSLTAGTYYWCVTAIIEEQGSSCYGGGMVSVTYTPAVVKITVKAPVQASYTYNAEAAMTYAKNNVATSTELCAGFVSKCVQAGGLNVYDAGTGPLVRKIYGAMGITTGTGTDFVNYVEKNVPTLALDANGSPTKAANSSKLKKGDVVFQWCFTHHVSPHILICNGYNANGVATFYATHGRWNNAPFDLSENTAYDHTKNCNMVAKVIQIG